MPEVRPESNFQHFVRLKRAGAKGIVVEGDSWFAFPALLRVSLIQHLIKAYGDQATWFQLQSNGDEAREMMCGEQYTEFLNLQHRLRDANVAVDAILFSGGGNDIVGASLLPLLNDYQDGMDYMQCINHTRFEARLAAIKLAYEELAHLRDDYQPQAWIFTHAYDYAVVSGKPVHFLCFAIGPWIKQYMEEEKGIVNNVIQQKIIDHLLSQFDDLHTALEQTHENWCYVRTQGTLTRNDWGDELHPTEEGFAKIAAKFRAALEEKLPGLTSV
ncbi:MAG: hypothetical protein EXS35_00390 [Pedosphaera sp.]|nr:hypothetical protein [Pedosphaera sp.]